MPYSTLTDEQILELLAEQSKMLAIPGVASVWVEYASPGNRKAAVGVTVYAGNRQAIARLPRTVAGLPVIVRLEEDHTRRVLEVIELRKDGRTAAGHWTSQPANPDLPDQLPRHCSR